MWKRDIQGKFALKNDDYRQVRSLRLTDETWKVLGITEERQRAEGSYAEGKRFKDVLFGHWV